MIVSQVVWSVPTVLIDILEIFMYMLDVHSSSIIGKI